MGLLLLFSIKVDLDEMEDFKKSEKQFTILSGVRGFQSVCPSCSDLWIRSAEALKEEKKDHNIIARCNFSAPAQPAVTFILQTSLNWLSAVTVCDRVHSDTPAPPDL